MKTAIRIFAVISLLWLAGSCERPGFKVKAGRVVYVTWNEGDGTIVRDVDGADPKSFEVIPNPTNKNFTYAKDASHVYLGYYEPHLIDDADPATFAIIDEEGWYAKDRNHAYFWGAEIKNADAATFRTLPHGYAKDAKRAFLGVLEIPVKDVASFEPLKDGFGDEPWHREGGSPHQPATWSRRDDKELRARGWSRDAAAVYFGTEEMANIDPKFFTALGILYAKDTNTVYFADKVIAGADAASFDIIPNAFNENGVSLGAGPDARDKKENYRSGKVIK